MTIQQFRDVHGYLMPASSKPRYIENPKENKGFYAAKMVYCPERDGLIAIGNCVKCEFYNGIKKYKGVQCKSQSKRVAPEYYNKLNPKKYDNECDD